MEVDVRVVILSCKCIIHEFVKIKHHVKLEILDVGAYFVWSRIWTF